MTTSVLTLFFVSALISSASATTSISSGDPFTSINATSSQPATNRINGQIVPFKQRNKVPYVAKITGGGSGCTGVLIRPEWILTAAHCIKDVRRTVTLRNGTFKETLKSKRGIPRPEYYKIGNSPQGNDVGLVQLIKPSIFDPVAMLEHAESRTQSIGTAYGYGYHVRSDKLVISKKLRTTSLKLTWNDYDMCPKGLPRTVFCPLVQKERDGMCPGDSGGPLMIEESEPLVYGIQSAARSCLTSKKKHPQFELVPHHYRWIVDTINKYEAQDAEYIAILKNGAKHPLPYNRNGRIK